MRTRGCERGRTDDGNICPWHAKPMLCGRHVNDRWQELPVHPGSAHERDRTRGGAVPMTLLPSFCSAMSQSRNPWAWASALPCRHPTATGSRTPRQASTDKSAATELLTCAHPSVSRQAASRIVPP